MVSLKLWMESLLSFALVLTYLYDNDNNNKNNNDNNDDNNNNNLICIDFR